MSKTALMVKRAVAAFIATGFVLALAAGAIRAQEKNAEKPDGEPDFSKVLSAMKTKLDLTGEQESEVSRLFREYKENRKNVMEKYPGSDDDDMLSRRIEIRRLNKDIESKIESLLAPDQLDMYRGIAREHRAAQRAEDRGRIMDERIEETIQRLALTGEQAEKVRPVLEEQAGRMRDLMEKNGGPGRGGMERGDGRRMEGMREEIENIESETERRLEKILDRDQMKEYRKIIKERREKMRGKRGGPGGPGGPGDRGGSRG